MTVRRTCGDGDKFERVSIPFAHREVAGLVVFSFVRPLE
jgi:hypothetical protein